MIEGFNIRCTVGGLEVLRSPRIVLALRRRAIVSRCELDVPDTDGSVQAALAKKQPVRIRFGHRGEGGTWHDWSGTVSDFQMAGEDAVRVVAVGREQALLDTKVTEAMYGEPADVVARRLLASTGLPVADIAIPSEVLPHIVFSGVSVAMAIKQLASTLDASFGHDMSKHAVWLGESGLYWSDGDEPGDIPVIESAENLISHSPNPSGMSEVVATVIPGLTHSRIVRIRDSRRQFSELVRAQEVIHSLGEHDTTTIRYGSDEGWA